MRVCPPQIWQNVYISCAYGYVWVNLCPQFTVKDDAFELSEQLLRFNTFSKLSVYLGG